MTETRPTLTAEQETALLAQLQQLMDPLFTNRGQLRHVAYRDAVLASGPVEAGPGGRLWYYADGVWRPGGEDEVRRRSIELLGDRWTPARGEQVVKDLVTRRPFITGEQPREFINCRNGLLDWRTGELHPHTPSVPSAYQLAVEWDPDATCPTIDGWMAQAAPDDAVDLVWEVIGQSLYPDQPIQKAVLLLGKGRNGKGTFLRLVKALVGDDHFAAVPFRALAEDRFAAADLFGKVVNLAGDLDARSVHDTGAFKQATGGDPIRAQRKGGQPFNFVNRATMLFAANDVPGSADRSHGFLSRWVVIPFTKLQIPEGREDPTLEPRMHQELGGALVRAVDGLRRSMERGRYSEPDSVRAAVEAYKTEVDPLRRFVSECLDATGDFERDVLDRRVVRQGYERWCGDNGYKPKSAHKMWADLKDLLGDRVRADINDKGPGGRIRYARGLRPTDEMPPTYLPDV